MPVEDYEQKVNKFFNLMKKSVDDDDFCDFFRADETGVWSVPAYRIPTGVPQLDIAIGKNGYPAGRSVELYGWEMSGKTTLALHAAREMQKFGGMVLWVDTEQSFDKKRATELGVDTSRVMVSSVATIEAGFRVVQDAINNMIAVKLETPFLIVMDSAVGTVTEWEAGKKLEGEERIGTEARTIRRAMKKVTSILAQSNAIAIFTNHNIARMTSYGKQSQSAGGHALKFYSSIRIECTSIGKILKKDSKDEKHKIRLGQNLKIEVEKVKGKLIRPIFEVQLLNDVGFDRNTSLLDAMCVTGLAEKTTQKTYTIFPETESETHCQRNNFHEVVEQFGGYDAMYQALTDDAIEKGFLENWCLENDQKDSDIQ